MCETRTAVMSLFSQNFKCKCRSQGQKCTDHLGGVCNGDCTETIIINTISDSHQHQTCWIYLIWVKLHVFWSSVLLFSYLRVVVRCILKAHYWLINCGINENFSLKEATVVVGDTFWKITNQNWKIFYLGRIKPNPLADVFIQNVHFLQNKYFLSCRHQWTKKVFLQTWTGCHSALWSTARKHNMLQHRMAFQQTSILYLQWGFTWEC